MEATGETELKSPQRIGKKNTARENEEKGARGICRFSPALLLAVTPL